MTRFFSTLFSSWKAAWINKVQSKTILDNATAVFQRLRVTDLGPATFELSAAGQIGIQIVEIIKVRSKTPIFDKRN
jgi:hypothetical protein